LWLLVVLSVLSVAITVERVVFMFRNATDRPSLAALVGKFLNGGPASEFQTALVKLGGAEARVLAAGMEMAPNGPASVEKAMDGSAKAERLKMERGLSFLATVGSNAPFLGLFGTVLDILRAFHQLDMSSGETSTEVMGAIAGALVATATGLAVAIPAVVLYNALNRWVRGRLGRLDSVADLVIARLQGEADSNGG
jgi:biopolymer transport protein ExbB